MMHNSIVVGICNTALSEKMQLQPDLDLKKAIMQVHQAEAIKQQPLLRGRNHRKNDTPVGAVHKGTWYVCLGTSVAVQTEH